MYESRLKSLRPTTEVEGSRFVSREPFGLGRHHLFHQDLVELLRGQLGQVRLLHRQVGRLQLVEVDLDGLKSVHGDLLFILRH